jgi:hypothetical protein
MKKITVMAILLSGLSFSSFAANNIYSSLIAKSTSVSKKSIAKKPALKVLSETCGSFRVCGGSMVICYHDAASLRGQVGIQMKRDCIR